MRLEDAFVLTADTVAGDALRRLQRLPAEAMVVVLRENGDMPRYYAFSAGAMASSVARAPAEIDLTTALNLHEWGATPSRQLGTLADPASRPAPAVATPTVVLHGEVVVGVAMPTEPHGTRSSDPNGAGDDRRPATFGADPSEHDDQIDASDDTDSGGSEGSDDDSGDAPDGRDDEIAESAIDDGHGDDADDSALFRAFPGLDAPDAVVHGEPFTLEVRLQREPDPAAVDQPSSGPILVADAPKDLAFVVSVVGFGFTFPDQVRKTLEVARDDPGRSSVAFTVVAEPVRHDVVRVLEVSFEHAGNVCGRAWREVHVGSADAPVPSTPPQTGGAGIATPPLQHTPHLTIEIRSQQGDAELEWLFHSRYTDLPLPTDQVTTRLDEGSAKEFAVQVMGQLPAQQGSPFLDDAVRGVGRRVAGVLPSELWPLLDAAWTKARDDGDVPSLLIQTNEPYVPWELAWLDDDYVDASLLPDPEQGGALGQLWRVGRWIPPIARTPRGGDRPPSPPAHRIDINAMAVVIGDYASDAKLRPLPEAIEEGKEIAIRYRALPLMAIEADIALLMSNKLVRNGAPFSPQAVHMAAHGQVSPDTQQYTGIILSKTGRRLDPLIVQGSWLSRQTMPFVFLNACQVGTAGKVLSDYGGLAAAFLTEGCRAFVAPLWNVDDAIARKLAVAFYEAALDKGTPVAEILRELRGRFGTAWAAGTATPLAYVFYGHPSLMLHES